MKTNNYSKRAPRLYMTLKQIDQNNKDSKLILNNRSSKKAECVT